MRTHGHTYFVNLTIVGDTLDHNGFLINFSELKRLVHDQFDHYLLNDLPQFRDKSPSTEIVAQTILKSYKLILTSMTINLNVYKCIYVKHHQVMLSIVQRRLNNAFKNTSFRNFWSYYSRRRTSYRTKTMFVRTAGCDYRCSWCDSAFTWDGSAKDDIELLTAQDIYDRLKEIGGNQFDHVTISGGNPALIKGIQDLVDLFEEKIFLRH